MGDSYTGDLIRKYRKDKGLTQKQLGNLCNPKINEANIRKYELGTQFPKIETLRRIATALNVSLGELSPDWASFTPEEIKEDLGNMPAGTIISIVRGKGHATKKEVTEALRKGAKDKLDTLNYLGVSRGYDYINYLSEKPENTEPDK